MTRLLLLALLSACRSAGPDGKDSGAPDSVGEPADSSATASCSDPMDLDADGYPDLDAACQVVDCDDTDPARFPGATDTPEDGVDQDCDGDDDCGYGPPRPGDLEVNSLFDAVAFCARHRAVEGSLVVYGVAELTDLSALSCLCAVGEDVDIEKNPGLTSLHGLEGLTGTIPGYLTVRQNDALWDVSALGNVRSVGIRADIEVKDEACPTPAVRSLESGGYIYLSVDTNPTCEDLDDLSRLRRVTGGLGLDGLGIQDLTGLGGVEDLGDGLGLSFTGVRTLDGLDSLVSARGLYVEETDLESLAAFPALGELDYVHLASSQVLASLDGLEWIVNLERLQLYELPALPDLQGLEGLTEISGDPADVDWDLQLDTLGVTSLHGLENLRTITGDVYIRYNPDLTDLSALHGVEHIDGVLIIIDNPSLSDAEAWALVDAIGQENITEGVDIRRNLDD